MAKTRFHHLFDDKLKLAVESRMGSIANGDCADYPSYRESVGFLRGLMAAREMAEEVNKELE